METRYYLQRIREAFPELKWTKHRRIQTQRNHPDHVMILLDNGIAFRFENDLEDEDSNLVRERTVLNALKGRLKSIPFPDYTFIPESPDFAGYRAIRGTRLSPWRFERLSKRNRAEAAQRLGTFLSELHSYPISEAQHHGVRNRVREHDPSEYNRLKAIKTFAEQKDKLQPEVRDMFEKWIAQSESIDHSFEPVLAHDDLWYKHIYHDPSTGKLTGIIDWGDIEIADPAKDFYGFWVYGEPFLDKVLSHYDYNAPNLKTRSFEHFWGIAILSWFSRPPGGRFFKRSTWSTRPIIEWPMAKTL